MADYLVTWEIDADGKNDVVDAALSAFEAMRDSESIATVFNVCDKKTGRIVQVDLATDPPTAKLIRSSRIDANVEMMLLRKEIEDGSNG